ncbi:response regulator transcription factor [Candidatus Soleaferrea massiliensis]|uniref:response regulator transcription factor n=1 Tax=Candidatus Soleaferrea massiliensis TaxID=1470354 RepID=UPI000590C69D|nr:response regulator transcription factor [Candidatus Soleaferrea massiliensis]
MRLLIAEDDTRLLKSLKHIFESNQYMVDAVSNGIDALTYAESEEYDGLIFDIMMPGLDGIDVLKRLRENGVSTPALFLTAKTEIYQRVEGLDAGADDYLPKPFSTPELLARVRAMLRRRDNYAPDLCKFRGLTLNRSTYELQFENEKIALSGREYQIMEMLMERPNFVIPIDDFISHVWGWESDVDVSVIWVHISNIRKKLVSIKAKVEIRFIRGAGYKLEEIQ